MTTNADIRAEIAAALSTVAGVKGFANRPSTIGPGDAWPQWRGSTRVVNGYVYENAWAVIIALPNADDVTADSFIDSHGDALAQALRHVMSVEEFQPVNIGTEGSPSHGLMISGRAE